MQPKLSIVLTVYNMDECLTECLESLETQTYHDYEMICVDDGSTDSSPAILADFAHTRGNVIVVTQENRGPAEARNTGLFQAQGEYVMLLDSDDVFAPSFLKEMVEAIELTEADVVICRATGFDHATGKPEPIDWAVRDELLPKPPVSKAFEEAVTAFAPADLKGCPFIAFMGWPWDKIYRTAFLRDNGIVFPDLPNAEDLYFVYAALAKAEMLAFLDRELIRHRMNRGSSVSSSRLASPRSFYDGICMLKSELQKNPALYRQFEWGLLNWAFDYTIWNINTLPKSDERTELIVDFVGSKLEALEMASHPLSYYSLYPDNVRDFRNLQDEVAGTTRKGKIWEDLAYLCEHFRRKGFFGTIARVLKRKSGKG